MSLSEMTFEQISGLSASQMFDLRVEETPDAVAVRSVVEELTFAQWRVRAWSIRQSLEAHLGSLRGERVSLWMSNDEACTYVSAFQAVLDAGAITVALDDRLAIEEAIRVLLEAEPAGLLLGPLVATRLGPEGLARLGVREVAFSALRGGMILVALQDGHGEGGPVIWSPGGSSAEALPAVAQPADDAMIAYTSGSTGKPKGALWTQVGLCQYAERVANAIYGPPRDGRGLRAGDVLQSPIPLYTAASIIENVYPSIFAGCTLLYEGRRFDAAASETRMQENGTTVYNGVPPHYALMCQLPSPTPGAAPELMVTSGSALTPDLYRRMRTRWPTTAIANWYGLNESGTGQTLNFGSDMERAPSSIGRPIWPTEVKIMGEDGQPVPTGAQGELWMRAPAQMSGYFRNPTETAKRLCDGWLRTGDHAILDREGLIHVVGRGEERINRGGFKFYPAEIEFALEEHHAVREAAVVAVPHPVLGEDPVAFVVVNEEVGEQTLRDHCRQRIAANKLPSRIVFVEELPRGAYGKVVRRELLTRYCDQPDANPIRS